MKYIFALSVILLSKITQSDAKDFGSFNFLRGGSDVDQHHQSANSSPNNLGNGHETDDDHSPHKDHPHPPPPPSPECIKLVEEKCPTCSKITKHTPEFGECISKCFKEIEEEFKKAKCPPPPPPKGPKDQDDRKEPRDGPRDDGWDEVEQEHFNVEEEEIDSNDEGNKPNDPLHHHPHPPHPHPPHPHPPPPPSPECIKIFKEKCGSCLKIPRHSHEHGKCIAKCFKENEEEFKKAKCPPPPPPPPPPPKGPKEQESNAHQTETIVHNMASQVY